MKLKSLLLSLFFVLATTLSFSQVLSFNVQTVICNKNSHIAAIWITNSSNVFVKTIFACPTHKYTSDLHYWVASSVKNIVDATTSASFNHPTLPVLYTWNCTNVSRVVVPDGNYYVNVEFTDENLGSSSKYMKYPFTIGPASSVTVPDVTTDPGKYITKVSYSTTISVQTPINEAKTNVVYNISYQPNAKLLQVKYDAQVHHGVVAKIFDAKGALVSQQDMPEGSSSIVLNKLSKGVYLIKFIDAKGVIETKRFVAQ